MLAAWSAIALALAAREGWSEGRWRIALASLFVCMPLLAAGLAAFFRVMREAPPARAAWAALAIVVLAHALIVAAWFPGLIISDALHVYYISHARGHIDDYYGYLWPLALNAARLLFDHPATMTFLQLAYFAGLLAYAAASLRRRGEPPWVAVATVLLIGLAPAALCSATYQHRDAFTALLSLNWALVTWFHAPVLFHEDGAALRRALGVQVLLLCLVALARPELVVAGVATLLAIAAARAWPRPRRAPRAVLAAALAALLLPLLYTAVATRVVPVEKRAIPYLVTLFGQPVGFILSRPDAVVHPGMVEAANRIFAPGKLVETHTPRNLFILWTPHMLPVADPQHHADFYRHSVRLILSNLPEALANRVMVYLHGNGYGPLAEPHQDQASTYQSTFRASGFEPWAQRPASLAPVVAAVRSTFEGSILRPLVWGTIPFLLLALVVLLRASPRGPAWLLAFAMSLRAAALFVAAPSAQLAYHLSVLFLGLVLVATALPCARSSRESPQPIRE